MTWLITVRYCNAKFDEPHIILKWNIATDLDLHVIDPNG